MTTISTTSLESLAIKGLSILESLIESSGELFTSLLEYSTKSKEGDDNEDEKRKNVIKCYENYKNFEKELKGNIDNILEFQEKKKESILFDLQGKPESSNKDVINELIKTRESLSQESDTQKTLLTNLLEQTYKLQFQLQTLLSCSEQQRVILPEEEQQQQ